MWNWPPRDECPTGGEVDEYIRSQVKYGSLLYRFFAIAVGGLFGLLQTLVRSEMITLPNSINYYQILTAHGVLMAIVFTTFLSLDFYTLV